MGIDDERGALGAVRRHEVLSTGVFTGIVGGVAMMAVLMIAASTQGVPALRPLNAIGATFVGPEALAGGAKLAFGALIHLATSMAFGVAFAALAPKSLYPSSAVGLGAGFVLLVMGFMMTVIVPWVNPSFRDGVQVIGGSWVLAHGVFGLVLGTAPALRRRLSPAQAAVPAPAGAGAPRPGVPRGEGRARSA